MLRDLGSGFGKVCFDAGMVRGLIVVEVRYHTGINRPLADAYSLQKWWSTYRVLPHAKKRPWMLVGLRPQQQNGISMRMQCERSCSRSLLVCSLHL